MKRYNLEWQGVKYPAVDITIFPGESKEEDVIVSVINLEATLIDCARNGIGASEAEEFVERIGCFLSEDEIRLPDDELRKLTEANC